MKMAEEAGGDPALGFNPDRFSKSTHQANYVPLFQNLAVGVPVEGNPSEGACGIRSHLCDPHRFTYRKEA